MLVAKLNQNYDKESSGVKVEKNKRHCGGTQTNKAMEQVSISMRHWPDSSGDAFK
jgi:hypothetical protein